MTTAERMDVVWWLTYVERHRLLKRVRDANPGVIGNELAVLFIAECYGQELADRVRAWVEERRAAGIEVKLGAAWGVEMWPS